jgi:cellulose synthase/poly-beta-1,6-N-acetylglucosamine synthase-like glycosyltransferase
MKTDLVTDQFIAEHSQDCSHILITPWQKLWYAGLIVACLFTFAYRWDVLLFTVLSVLAFLYFGIVVFRTIAVTLTLVGLGEVRVSKEQVFFNDTATTEIYTILVPLYKEANIAERIVAGMNGLDYPHEKLDVKLLLEEDDEETINAVRSIELSEIYEVIVVPDAQPKTKPKACNHGLKRAKGEFCVIFDAEDRPDADQLKKVIYAFRNAPEKLACIQGKLNYFNAKQNLLTRWFTIEYSTTFDLYLAGLQMMKVPVPLGGTSNHFRTSVLRELGGWDPFNVTEDCDLGVRIYKRGYSTCLIDSTTWEEANSRPWNWIRQRSRWVKGFFQTHLTHSRNPLRTLRQLGPWGYAGFFMSVGGSAMMMVLNLIYWIVGGTYLAMIGNALLDNYTLWEVLKGPREQLGENWVWPMIYFGDKEDPMWSSLSIVFFAVAVLLLFTNVLFVLMHVAACLRRKYYNLLPAALLMPIYWVMISIGAWKGFIQLFTNPFYWEKTVHGLDHPEEDEHPEVHT